VMIELAEQGMTMLVVAHEMGFARAVADAVICMDEGQIIERPSRTRFFNNPQASGAGTSCRRFWGTEGREASAALEDSEPSKALFRCSYSGSRRRSFDKKTFYFHCAAGLRRGRSTSIVGSDACAVGSEPDTTFPS
jgi:ABC-type methionine transport system ATPase subunit